MSPHYYAECTCPVLTDPGPHHPDCATESPEAATAAIALAVSLDAGLAQAAAHDAAEVTR